MTPCPSCKLPRFYGPSGYAGPACQCAHGYRPSLLAPVPINPLCPYISRCHPGHCPCHDKPATEPKP